MNIPQEQMNILQKTADKIYNQKHNFSSSQQWSKDRELTGLMGEQIYATLTHQQVNLEIKINGDSGIDFYESFGTVDVKASSYYGDPWLKIPPNKLRADFYVLIGINMYERKGYVAGWISRGEISKTDLKSIGKGGLCYCIPHYKLHPGLPPT